MEPVSTPETALDRVQLSRLDLGRIALAHDYLNQRGGAERVALELAQMWPEAPLYTSLYRPESTFPGFRSVDVRTSFLDRLPVDRRFRNLFPLYPAAFRSLAPIDADLLITSSSGWAHRLTVRPGARHVVYCHNPARWLKLGPRRSDATEMVQVRTSPPPVRSSYCNSPEKPSAFVGSNCWTRARAGAVRARWRPRPRSRPAR